MNRLAVTAATTIAIALLLISGSALAKEQKEHKVDIDDLKYTPAKIQIKKGEKVIWKNSDDRDHTVVCKSKEKDEKGKEKKVFDSGKIAAGKTFEYTFKESGKFEYGCEYHPRMKGVVEVAD